MNALGRGFVAVVPPDDVLDAIEARVAPVRAAEDGLRWSRREQWHLTLRFLGPVPDVDGLVGALHDALARVPRIDALVLAGAGAFPNARRASVVWFGARDAGEDGGEDGEALRRLAAAVESASVAAGFAPEPRPFRPHLTVARVARPRGVGTVVDALGDDAVGRAWSVEDVVLVASDTRPSGAVYSEIARVPLATMGA
jgi:2'-5' RNA ligase